MSSKQNAINMTQVASVKTQVFTGNGTYTPSTGLINCIVEIVGGGGGSGGSTGSGGQSGVTGGGQGGGYCLKLYTAAQIGANATIVIGGGGPGGASGNNNGTAGSDSTFTPAGAGAVLTAAGGSGSAGGNSTATFASYAAGFTAGTGTNGDVNITGGIGSVGFVFLGSSGQVLPGTGGGSQYGRTNPPVNISGTLSAKNYGAGAAGALAVGGANVAGLDGSGGICIVTEFCNQ